MIELRFGEILRNEVDRWEVVRASRTKAINIGILSNKLREPKASMDTTMEHFSVTWRIANKAVTCRWHRLAIDRPASNSWKSLAVLWQGLVLH